VSVEVHDKILVTNDQSASVVALSVTEGADEPLKYPVMFRKADLVLLTKVDLLPHLELDVAAVGGRI
jgi:hydrogenase nickel incorporation protein HypB